MKNKRMRTDKDRVMFRLMWGFVGFKPFPQYILHAMMLMFPPGNLCGSQNLVFAILDVMTVQLV